MLCWWIIIALNSLRGDVRKGFGFITTDGETDSSRVTRPWRSRKTALTLQRSLVPQAAFRSIQTESACSNSKRQLWHCTVKISLMTSTSTAHSCSNNNIIVQFYHQMSTLTLNASAADDSLVKIWRTATGLASVSLIIRRRCHLSIFTS